MVSYTLITLATAAAVSAQAVYGSSQNQTQVDCYIKYNECRTTRVNGASANQAACAASFAGCLGYSPFNSDGTNTVTPSYTLPAVSRTSSATSAPTQSAVGCQAAFNKCRQPAPDGTSANQAQCAAENAACKGKCDEQYNTCRTTRTDGLSANQAACAAQYAGCLGTDPFEASSSATGNQYTTQTLTAYTTVCPSPTTFTYGPSTYTVKSSTTITLPCPTGCVVTTPVAPPATTAPAPPNTQAPPPLTTVTRPSQDAGVPTPAASTTRAVYTGAAMKVSGNAAFLVGALGLFAL